MIRSTLLLALSISGILHGAELTVYTSNPASNDDMVSASVWYSDGSVINKEPDRSIIQEGQIIREVYRGLMPGKYRVVLNSLGPIGSFAAVMETHLTLSKDSSDSVILVADGHKQAKLPEEIEVELRKHKDMVDWELLVRYPGFEAEFTQARYMSEVSSINRAIVYLRSDGEYTLKIWNDDPSKGVMYSKTFKVGDKKESEQAAPSNR